MTRLWKIADFRYKWLNIDGRDYLKINDYMLELPVLSIPENARYIGPLLQGLYGRHRPCTISRRLQLLLIETLEHDPNYFQNVMERRWYYIPQVENKSRNIKKKRGRKPRAYIQTPVVELD